MKLMCNNKKKRVRRMTTQIAATPVIKGPGAIRIWEEAHRKPSKESKENAKKLAAFFEQETIKYDFKN